MTYVMNLLLPGLACADPAFMQGSQTYTPVIAADVDARVHCLLE